MVADSEADDEENSEDEEGLSEIAFQEMDPEIDSL